jgi:hypothetical protein
MRQANIIIIITIMLCARIQGLAQTPRNMYEDIRLAIPHYSCSVDDYTQYVPAALTL